MSRTGGLGAALQAAADRARVPPMGADLDELLRHFVSVVKHSSALPRGSNHHGMMEIPAFEAQMTDFGERLLAMIVKVAQANLPGVGMEMRDIADCSTAQSFEAVADATDTMLEHAASALDKRRTDGTEIALAPSAGAGARPAFDEVAAKPQDSYGWRRVPSRAAGPFVPQLASKPFAAVPLAQALRQLPDGSYTHPYEPEIARWSAPAWLLQRRDPAPYAPLEASAAVEVADRDALARMCADLVRQPAVAVDLEHHSYRSYLGLLCLMQVSTPRTDYLVDVFAVWDHMQMCAEWLACPDVVKVMHGADRDVLWLQRDFSLFVVGLFDTGRAARRLALPSFGLAHLLKSVCGVDADKKHQRSDWRVRPLPPAMRRYAREDTHYLLHIADVLTLRLLARGRAAVEEVVDDSRRVALQRFEAPRAGPAAHATLLQRLNLTLAPPQRRAFAALFDWRDALARRVDESTGFVMPNAVLAAIAQRVPTSVDALRRAANPLPPALAGREEEMVAVVVASKRGAAGARPYEAEVLRPGPAASDPAAAAAAAAAEEEEESEEDEDGDEEEDEDSVAATIEPGASVRRAFDAAGWRSQQRPAMVLESDGEEEEEEEEEEGEAGGASGGGANERWARVGRRAGSGVSSLALWDGAAVGDGAPAWGSATAAPAHGGAHASPHASAPGVTVEMRAAAARWAFPSVQAVARALTAGGEEEAAGASVDAAGSVLTPALSAEAAARRCEEVMQTVSLLALHAEAFARAERAEGAEGAEGGGGRREGRSGAQLGSGQGGEGGEGEEAEEEEEGGEEGAEDGRGGAAALDAAGVPRSIADIFRVSNAHKGRDGAPAGEGGDGHDLPLKQAAPPRAPDPESRRRGVAIMAELGYTLPEAGDGGGKAQPTRPAGWVEQPAFAYSRQLASAAGAVPPPQAGAGAASAYLTGGRGGKRGGGRGRRGGRGGRGGGGSSSRGRGGGGGGSSSNSGGGVGGGGGGGGGGSGRSRGRR